MFDRKVAHYSLLNQSTVPAVAEVDFGWYPCSQVSCRLFGAAICGAKLASRRQTALELVARTTAPSRFASSSAVSLTRNQSDRRGRSGTLIALRSVRQGSSFQGAADRGAGTASVDD
jgi:hypothetical protein